MHNNWANTVGGGKMKYDLTGYNIDNLLKTLYNKKIVLKNVNRDSHNHITFELLDGQVKKAQKYIANFKIKQTPSFFKRLPKLILANLGLVIAIFVGCVFYLFSNNYIWQICIFGTKDLTQNDVLQVLNQNGVKIGKLNVKSAKEIETILLENYDKIAQVSVIKQGTAIVINLSEKLVYNATTFEPIKAKFNGIITKINLITGTTNIKVGDYVNAGDDLILPFNLDKSGNKISVKPMAEIEAKMFVVGTAQIAKTETVLLRSGKSQICYDYSLFNKHIFFGKNKNSFALFENVSYNEIISGLVPLKRKVNCFYELVPTEITHDLEEERQNLLDLSQTRAEQQLKPNFAVVDTQQTTQLVADKLYAYTILTVTGQIND